jgi:hypothetical protein
MQNAVLVRLGAVTFVNPTAELNLSPRQWSKLDAAIWLSPLMKERAREMVAEVEEGLGVTQADRRYARLVHKGQVIVPARAGASVLTFGPALFVDEGKSERVLVLTDAKPHPESGEPEREVSFMDRDGEVFIVKAANLCPCDDLWRALPLAPEALETGKWAGVPQNAEAAPSAAVARVRRSVGTAADETAVEPGPAVLPVSGLSASQAGRLKWADKLAKGKTAQERARGRVILLTLQREVTGDAESAAVKAGIDETVVQAKLRGDSLKVDAKGRLSRQTSLDSLVSSGSITAMERAAGERYGVMYEAAYPPCSQKVANWEAMPAGGDHDPMVDRLDKADAARGALDKVHTYVSERIPGDRAVWILKLVAGQGRRLAHISASGGRPSGGHRDANTKALQLALQALADKWGLQ